MSDHKAALKAVQNIRQWARSQMLKHGGPKESLRDEGGGSESADLNAMADEVAGSLHDGDKMDSSSQDDLDLHDLPEEELDEADKDFTEFVKVGRHHGSDHFSKKGRR